MKKGGREEKIPRSRIATFDTFEIGMRRHHVAALLEFDVTESRRLIKAARRGGDMISFNAWLIKVIGDTLVKHPEAAAFRKNRRKMVIFDDISISMLVEKRVGEKRVPLPVVIQKVNTKTAAEIYAELSLAVEATTTAGDIVINRKSMWYENLYYMMPGSLRRLTWRVMLASPSFAYSKMGNASVTSVGMMGKINGWFIHRSVHPVSFGIGSVIRKPVVAGNSVEPRDILNMTILADHDLIDGAPMVRMLNDLTRVLENGVGIDID